MPLFGNSASYAAWGNVFYWEQDYPGIDGDLYGYDIGSNTYHLLGNDADKTVSVSYDGATALFIDYSNHDIFVVDVDNPSSHTDVSNGDQNRRSEYASLSPDGTKIAYYKSSHYMAVMDSDGSDLNYYTPDNASAILGGEPPVWSPDGSHVAFYMDVPSDQGNTGLWVMGNDCSDPHLIAATSYGANFHPSFSADSSQLVFSRQNGDFPDLFIGNVHGCPDLQQITFTTGQREIDPDWSPNGDRIVYVDDTGSTSTVDFIDPQTHVSQGFINVSGNYHDPNWSSDGSGIIFEDALMFPRVYIARANDANALTTLVATESMGSFGSLEWVGGYYGNISDSGNDSSGNTSSSAFSIGNAVCDEGGTLNFVVTRSGGMGKDTIYYNANALTAIGGVDYVQPSTGAYLTFEAGVASQTISITTNQDNLWTEPATETLEVVLSNPTNGGTLPVYRGVGTINHVDPQPATFSIGDVSGAEGQSLQFVVTRGGNIDSRTKVNFATSNGTAISGNNYAPLQGTLVFGSGETSKTITISTIDDHIWNPSGSVAFDVLLTDPSGHEHILQDRATGTLREIDPEPPSYYVNDGTCTEGGNLSFSVVRSGNTAGTSAVNFVTYDQTAIASNNYTALQGSLTFAAGETEKTVSIATLPDHAYRGSLALGLRLSGRATDTRLLRSEAMGTIYDADIQPSEFSIADASAMEGNECDFIVTRSGNTAVSADVNYQTVDGTASGGNDYTPLTGTLHFAAGESQGVIRIDTQYIAGPRSPETFAVTLFDPTGNDVLTRPAAVGTIIDVDKALDVYVLTDASRAYRDDLLGVAGVTTAWQQILSFVPGIYGGVGSFVDQPCYPFGYETVDYVFANVRSLASGTTGVTDSLAAVAVGQTDGGDVQNDQVGALLQVANQADTLGFRADADRVVIICTNTPYHENGDLQRAITAEQILWGEDYDPSFFSTAVEYPGVAELREALASARIYPVFAVSEPAYLDQYRNLVTALSTGSVISLSADGSDLSQQLLPQLQRFYPRLSNG